MLLNHLLQAGLAFFIYRSGLGIWIYDHVVPPDLPTSYSSLFSQNQGHVGHQGASKQLLIQEEAGAALPLKFCEDATEWDIQRSQGQGKKTLVLLSCDPGRKEWNTVMGPLTDPNPRGVLWVMDPEAETPVASVVKMEGFPSKSDFHPLGIEVLRVGSDQRPVVYVVNHQRNESTVELFELNLVQLSPSVEATATYLTTLSDPSFTGAPNSIAIVSPVAFFLSHDHRHTRRGAGPLAKLLNFVETIGALPLSRVDLVELSSAVLSSTKPRVNHVRTVASRISFANGVALSRDKRTLAVASSTRKEVRLFNVDGINHALSLKERIKLPFHVDNLSLAPEEWIEPNSTSLDAHHPTSTFVAAGHPNFFSLAAVARGKETEFFGTMPSSWVVSISPRSGPAPAKVQTEPPSQGQLHFAPPPPPAKELRTDEDRGAALPTYKRVRGENKTWKLRTLFQSNGKQGGNDSENGFGMSTTGVVGVSWDGRTRWLVVPGLYETGVKFIRETNYIGD
ncbi:hypothetical protein T439DRAFT_298378 [Meredithblackwellia eburnea MCA 4105]